MHNLMMVCVCVYKCDSPAVHFILYLLNKWILGQNRQKYRIHSYRMRLCLSIFCLSPTVCGCANVWVLCECVLYVRSCTLLPVFTQKLFVCDWLCMCGGILFYGQCICLSLSLCMWMFFVRHYFICVTLFYAFFGSSHSVWYTESIQFCYGDREKRIKRNSKEKAPTRKQIQKHILCTWFSQSLDLKIVVHFEIFEMNEAQSVTPPPPLLPHLHLPFDSTSP